MKKIVLMLILMAFAGYSQEFGIGGGSSTWKQNKASNYIYPTRGGYVYIPSPLYLVADSLAARALNLTSTLNSDSLAVRTATVTGMLDADSLSARALAFTGELNVTGTITAGGKLVVSDSLRVEETSLLKGAVTANTKLVVNDSLRVEETSILKGDVTANTKLVVNDSLRVEETSILKGATTISGLAYPTVDGSNGQLIQTNGSGTLSFTSYEADTTDLWTRNTGSGYTYLTNADNVGIGTSTPATKFHVDGNMTITDNDWIGLGAAAGRIEFDDQATDEINFLATRVGIGTDTPGCVFHVSAASAPQIRISASDLSGANSAMLGHATGSNQFLSGSSSGDLCVAAPSAGSILFGTSSSAGAAQGERVRITKDGNVGIGVTPTVRLQVEGGNVIINDTGGAYDFRIKGDTKTNLFFADGSADAIGINDGTLAGTYDLEIGDSLYTGGNITVGGKVYVTGDVSAESFTDRCEVFEGNAIESLAAISKESGEKVGNFAKLDHKTLPVGVYKASIKSYYQKKGTGEKMSGEWAPPDSVKNDYTKIEYTEEGRDLSKLVSVLVAAFREQKAINEALEARLEKLEKK